MLRKRRLLGSVALLFLATGFAAYQSQARIIAAARAPSDPIEKLIAERRGAEAEARARTLLSEAERAHGADAQQTADAIDGLLKAIAAAGGKESLPNARGLAERAVRIKERLLGRDDPRVADTLSAFASMLWHFEEYRAERPLSERALTIRINAFGQSDPKTAASFYQLAEVLRMLGDYSGATRLHERALAIWEKTPDADPLGIAASLHYLGVIKWTTGDYARARELIERSLSIRQRTAGANNELVATSLNSLGSLALLLDDRAGALSMFERAQAMWETSLGPDSPHVARSLENQGNLLAEGGDHATAKRLFDRALAIRIKAFGPEHYLVARSLADLGRLAVLAGDEGEAGRLFERALAIQQRDPQARGPEISETLVDYAALASRREGARLSLDLSLRAEAIARENFLVTSRGLSEQEALRYEAVRRTGLDVALSELAPEDRAAPPLDLSDTASRVWDEVIRSRAMVLDAMAGRYRASRTSAPSRPGLREVAGRLPPDSALIAYVRYRQLAKPGGDSTSRYLALVLRPGTRRPDVVPLGTAQSIESLVGTWRAEVGGDPRLGSRQIAERRYQQAGCRLREAVWDPLEAGLAQVKMIFVVPDGAINLVSLAALPLKNDRYLIDTVPRIHYLSAERDLLLRHPGSAPGSGVLALGGAAFDAAPANAEAEAGGYQGVMPSCAPFATLRFDPIPGSKREADEVASLWRTKTSVLELTGPDASEAAFKTAAPGRRIIHLATHGYFLQDRCISAFGEPRNRKSDVTAGENPLRLTGLALAGANRRAEASYGTEDGVLTAEEIGALDLSGVEWAVLSGCETGLGPLMQGEGVLGLRRSFQVAGAGTLIMSLWPVDDGAARIWMRDLYEGRLLGLSTAEAVSRASLLILEEQRRRGRCTHPYYWGAFVAAGEWR